MAKTVSPKENFDLSLLHELPKTALKEEQPLVRTQEPQHSVAMTPPTASDQVTPVLYDHLQQWAKQLFNTPEQGVVREGSESPTIFLSRYGLKTPEAIAKFLVSPAGETVIHEIAQELQFEEAVKEQREIERRDHDLMVHRIKVALFLWYLDKKAHASKKLNELILDQAEKAMDRLHKATEQSPPSSANAKREAELSAVLREYDRALKTAKDQHTSLENKEQMLNHDLDLLMQFSDKLNQKYSLYEESLEEDFFASLLHPNGDLNTEAFELAHQNLSTQMEHLQDEIDKIIEADGDPTELIQELNALNLKFATMHDMKSVSEGKKFYNQASVDGKETHFVLENGDELMALDESNNLITLHPPGSQSQDYDSSKLFFKKNNHQMIQENGKVYLLKPGQDWDTVKDNPAMKENAHSYAKESFQRARQDIMTVKNVIGHHKGLENDIHGRRIQATHDLIKANAAEKELAANQIRLLQSAQADARAALRPQPQPNPAMTNMAPTMQLKPTVTPTVTKTSAPSPSPRPAPTIQVFKEHVEKLRRASSITQADLMNLTNEMPGAANQANARQYIESLLASGAKFSSASPQRRAQLLDRMEQLGIQTPFRHQQEVPTQEPRKSPTPFNTTPSPYK